MSGLDGLGWPNPEDEPKPKTMNTPNTAPKDTNFLGNFGWPWLCMTSWNEATSQWTYANMQFGLYEGVPDIYYYTENEPEDALKGWLPLPDLTTP